VRRALERFGGVRALAALIAAVAVALLLRYPGHLSAEASITEHDWFALHRFDLAQMQRAWSQGRIVPQWTPAVLGGTPLFAVPTKPFSYPPLWLATRLLGPDLAMNVLLFAHAAFGALGTALLARRLGQRGLGPIACALLFVLARAPAHTLPATPFSYGYAVALWPWFLIAWTDLLEGPRRVRAAVWVAVWGAAQWHTGGEPALYWLAAFVALYSLPWLARADVSLRAVAGPALLAALVLGGLAAPKLLPELAWLEHSGRGRPLDVEFLRDSALEEQHAARGGGSRLWTLARLAFEFADGGGRWVLIAGALLGLAASRSRRAWLALALGAAAGFVLASGALHELAWEWLPGYDRMRRHTRFVNAGFFGLIVMAGFGLQARPWAAATRRARALGWGALALGAALLLWDTGALPGVRWRHARLHSARERLELTARYYAAALADPGRFRIHHEENREQGVWSALGLESTSGLLGGPASRHPRLIELLPERASCGELEGDARGALDVLGVRYSACYQPLDAPRVEDVSLAGPARESADARLAGTRIAPFGLYRRTGVRARACAIEAPTLVVGTPAARWQWIAGRLSAADHDAAREVWIESEAADALALSRAQLAGLGAVLVLGADAGEAGLRRWAESADGTLAPHPAGALWSAREAGPTRATALEDARASADMDSLELDVAGLDTRFLLLAELFALFPGWTAEVDGRPLSLERCDGFATLLRLPEGARRLRLEYRPPGARRGLAIGLATLLILCVAAWTHGLAAPRSDG
jgi:hypothetical protein